MLFNAVNDCFFLLNLVRATIGVYPFKPDSDSEIFSRKAGVRGRLEHALIRHILHGVSNQHIDDGLEIAARRLEHGKLFISGGTTF